MKKILITATVLACLSFCNTIKAQDVLKETEELSDTKGKPGNKKTEEIVIRKNGDKEVNLKVEINGDKITVNGKPLSDFKDKDITINKRKMLITDDNDMRFSGDDKMGHVFKFDQNFGDNFSGNWNEDGNVNKPFLGVTSEEADGGVKINEIVKGSAAEKAGLKKGDILTKVGDEKITNPESLSEVIRNKKPSDEVKISYKRDGKETTTKAILGKRKNTVVKTFRFNGLGSGAQSFGPAQGAPFTNMEGFNDDVQDLTQNALENSFPFRKKIGLKIQDTEDGGNVKVINVEDSSAAAIAGLKKDDLITEINDKKVENTDDAREELMPDEDKKSYKIKALRNGIEMSFDVKIPRRLKTANF